MVSIKQLPYEICSQILQHTSKKGAFKCITLCKSWYQAAIEAFYKEITTQSTNIKYLTSNFSLKPQDEGYQKQDGRWVLTLKILDGGDSLVSFEENDFLHLLSLLPNLETLDLSNSYNCYKYLNILQKTGSSHYLKKIKQIVMFEAFDNLFTKVQLKVIRSLRFTTLHNFCDTITTLEVYCNEATISHNNISLLSEFKCLTHLSIKQSHAAGVTLMNVMECCQKFKSLAFQSSISAVPGFENHSFTDIQHQLNRNWNVAATANLSESPSSASNKYLEHIHLSLPSLALPYTMYLSTYLSQAVKCIEIMLLEAKLLIG